MTRTIVALVALTLLMQLAVLVQANARRVPVSACEAQTIAATKLPFKGSFAP